MAMPKAIELACPIPPTVVKSIAALLPVLSRYSTSSRLSMPVLETTTQSGPKASATLTKASSRLGDRCTGAPDFGSTVVKDPFSTRKAYGVLEDKERETASPISLQAFSVSSGSTDHGSFNEFSSADVTRPIIRCWGSSGTPGCPRQP